MKTLIVTLAGGLTCFLTAILLIVLQESTGFSLYGLSVLLVIPAGAILAGMVGATGYYFGARLVGCRPSGWLALNMVLVSAATFFLIQYLTYRTADVGGVPLNQLLTYPDFLDLSIRSTTIKRAKGRDNGPGQPLGVWGYPLAALKVLGFAAGGLVVYGILAARPYCRPCGRFLAVTGSRTRYHADFDETTATAEAAVAAFDAADPARLQPALDAHAAAGQPKAGKCLHRTAFTVWQCRGCGAGQTGFKLERHSGQNWVEVKEMSRTAETTAETELVVRDRPAGDPPRTSDV